MTPNAQSPRESRSSQLNDMVDSRVFDPKQDVQEKRWLRREYRQLIQKTEEHRTELVESDASSLVSGLRSANSLYDKVKNTYEATLDAKILILSADIGSQKAKKMRIEHDAFDIESFFTKLQHIVKGTHELEGLEETPVDPDYENHWPKLGITASKYARRAPASNFMFGPLMTELRVHSSAKTRQPRHTKNSESLVRPQQLEENDIDKQENETTNNVKIIFEILENVGPVNLFEFIINPESFSQTVENFFYLSFLIRDGKAYIDDESGQPMLESCLPPEQKDYAEGLVKKQLVMELDQPTWKELIRVYEITESIIPTRAQSVANVSGKWYG
ncbi:hypothetical protein H4R33_006388 [Dimargaris cristalligena]|uniref:Non-structural maintenance of chromosomes element 4 n=1 Tax=Dimargaris cristalligena TaxID=215637 RepID=A0A4Q0A0K8_9FUNG|nr:hypothetical protein H4R33_006388 [Dimargaris cristalligena]RKP39537.1 Nse4 C-terminal-domain-containing protein [Dimargaris cristalligena]|eukprot:RKP39537.1 Nse4 C-terminal-domain-containing protein [Dimargaris cristalligena]